jgi:NADPH-dependent curcumin reductase
MPSTARWHLTIFGDAYHAFTTKEDRSLGFLRLVMSRMLEVRGFGGALTGGQAALDDLTQWLLRDGAIRNVETVVDGLENAAAAFAATFEGGNAHVGKLIVQVKGA